MESRKHTKELELQEDSGAFPLEGLRRVTPHTPTSSSQHPRWRWEGGSIPDTWLPTPEPGTLLPQLTVAVCTSRLGGLSVEAN